jgi:septal ring factor EnvC (AmiA/AmiB activator)
VAKEGSKLGKEIERLKKRLQASKKHLKQTERRAEDLNALIENTRRTREGSGHAHKPPNKDGGR